MRDYNEIFTQALESKDEYEYKKSIEKFEEVVSITEIIDTTEDSSKKQLEALNYLGYLYDILGALEKAAKSYDRAYRLSKKNDESVNLLKATIGIGKIHDFAGKQDEAIEYFQQGVDLSTGALGKIYQAQCKELMALIHSHSGKMKEARKELVEAFAMIPDMEDPENIKISASITNQLGLIDFRKGSFPDAEDSFKKSMSLTENLPFCIERGVAMRYYAVILSIKKKFAEAFEYHLSALRIFKKNFFMFGKAKSYYSLGQIFTDVELYDQSIHFLKKSAKYFNHMKSKTNIAVIYGKIGILYIKIKDFDQAIQYFQKDLQISLELNYQRGLAHTYRNLGDAYLATEKASEVIAFYKKSIELFRKFNDDRNLAEVYLSLAKAYVMIGDFENARGYGDWALEQFKLTNRMDEIGQVHILYGRIHCEFEEWGKALGSYQEAIKILEETLNYSSVCEVKFSIARLIHRNGNEKEAIIALKDVLEYADK
ncbi:tetratricopeptide repeat protein, partial [bacterium]|nr:tetratricopeptide repeat protein [bacterium]